MSVKYSIPFVLYILRRMAYQRNKIGKGRLVEEQCLLKNTFFDSPSRYVNNEVHRVTCNLSLKNKKQEADSH